MKKKTFFFIQFLQIFQSFKKNKKKDNKFFFRKKLRKTFVQKMGEEPFKLMLYPQFLRKVIDNEEDKLMTFFFHTPDGMKLIAALGEQYLEEKPDESSGGQTMQGFVDLEKK